MPIIPEWLKEGFEEAIAYQKKKIALPTDALGILPGTTLVNVADPNGFEEESTSLCTESPLILKMRIRKFTAPINPIAQKG